MENSRRWSGFVCPDCRFVFRVPRDHDGKGIVCPSCRRVLKIPTPGDTPPPLMAPLRRSVEEEIPEETPPQQLKRKRRGRKPDASQDHSWEKQSHGPARGERKQMRFMLIGGGSLLAVIVAGVIFAFNSGDPVSSVTPPLTESDSAVGQPVAPAEVNQRSHTALAIEAEPIARKFLEAKTIDEILPLIRNPEITAERLRAAYPGGSFPALGLSEFSLHSATISGRFVSFSIRTRDFEPKTLVFIDEPGGLKLDWESSVGWSEMAWEEFLETKPVTPQIFRLIQSPVDYYNFEFRDDLKWQSYQLESPDKQHAVYGYVEKGSVIDEQLRFDADTKSMSMMLSLRFPEGATSSNQVLIERIVADGWIELDP